MRQALWFPAATFYRTPRYEYRVWERDLAELGARLAAQCEPLGIRVSEETYLVLRTDINVKIRSEVLDIKQLIGTKQGFQLWTPILKEAFPLPAPTVRKILGQLTGSDHSVDTVEPCEADQFLALAKEEGAAVAAVSKRRHGYVREGCILEFAEVTVNGSDLHTVAVESEDLHTATEVAAQLGIDDLPNRSYPMAIRQALGT